MPDNRLPVLILGQGLAGSCLALEFLKYDIPFSVIDVPWMSNSSRVAAGILNPLIFRYYTLSWRAEQYLDFSKQFYRELGETLKKTLLHEQPMLRIFGENEAKLWSSKVQLEKFSPYLSKELLFSFDGIDLRFGAGIVGATAWIDTALFVSEVRKLLKERGLLKEQQWSYDQLRLGVDEIEFEDVAYKSVVFCEGYRAVNNPYLKDIPFRPVKGDVITLKIPGFKSDYILNKNFFLVPLGDDLFRLGSTYTWDFTDEKPEPQAREKLLSDLSTVLRTKPEVLSHVAGIRPAIADRRPVAGRLPGMDKAFVFNGLGSRGGLLAPPLAHYLATMISAQVQPDAEVDPARFNRKTI
ncbi:MAG: FAD-binding oxidoreductase [Bacteroidia bacterium]|nr:FAD-binding oxidoreductase [Bacteroidia bacterium]